MPFHLREKAWEVLSPLTSDPDPTPDRESEPSRSSMDAATLSINTTRGEAMHSVIQYALWVRRQVEKEADAKGRLARGFTEMPEVKDVLEHRLDPAIDPSPAIRSVYGQWFPWLVLLDRSWAAQNALRIFPTDDASRRLWDAAWETYGQFCRPYDNVFEVLRDQYACAVEKCAGEFDESRGLEAPEFHLAQHLVTFYWRGKLTLDSDSLLFQFYARAPIAVRAHAIDFIGRSLHETKEQVDSVILGRLRDLWAFRLNWVRGSENASLNASELIGFGWWFASGKFEIAWSIAQLKETLKLTQKAELDALVVERLAELSPEMPLAAIECLTLIIEGDKEGWRIHGWRDHARRILMSGLRNEDQNTREAAIDLVHRLGAQGHLGFRDLLSTATV